MALPQITDQLVAEVERLRFAPPVTHVYNPLVYARASHDLYLQRFGRGRRRYLLLGMNPGPFGMAQTGIPFGEVQLVRDWLGIEAPVGKPPREHPKRPVQGFGCPRSEVSGARLWGWARDKFTTYEQFFNCFYIANYCPLVFMAESGRNITPDKLPAEEREPLFAACDRALRATVEHFRPTHIIGVGAFAEKRAQIACEGLGVQIGRILHPSPASPAANRGWDAQAEKQLRALGVEI
ncbi:single-stranded DNA-binding protein [Candidatus Sumerlaeota bacterium]|nr:single-stranded DNA-binding protein [Candidatus Sumerlaeota bacterium]